MRWVNVPHLPFTWPTRGRHVMRKTRGDGYHARVGLTLLTESGTVRASMMTSVPGVNSNVTVRDNLTKPSEFKFRGISRPNS
ncbi:hypothetical protein HanRHA438_Chr04g0176171 [Helianthus annuus]|nr:hypothetical protein HanRHA438_Chr04g0176171 [Helianthus annuus]